MTKLCFLGPKGTYSEIAANKIQKFIPQTELYEVSTIAKAIDIAYKKDYFAVLPVENSIEGIVRPTIDNIYSKDIKIQAALEIPIVHCLISKNNNKKNISHIISHPQALAQSQKYILENFDEKIDLINSSSTAGAAFELKDRDSSYCAIVSSQLAHNSNYNILDENIGDIKDNKTRFILISKHNLNLENKTRTSIVFNTKNEPGSLLKILDIIYQKKLNLIYLESRPSKKVFGEYNFFADIDCKLEENAPVLKSISEECNFYRFLGSYPVLKI